MEYNLIDWDDGVPLPPPPPPPQIPVMQQVQVNQPAAEPVAAVRNVRLPSFWVSAPRQWFATADAQFRLFNVTRSEDKFNLTVAALPEPVARQASHIIMDPPQFFQFEELRQHLTGHHELSDFEKVEKISRTEPLGGRKPTELLGSMLEFCPRGEENSVFMKYFFFKNLPSELRVMLAEEDHLDLRTLAARADRLAAHHQQRPLIAAVEPVEPAIAAVHHHQQNRGRGRGGRGGGQSRGGGQQNNQHQSSGQQHTSQQSGGQQSGGQQNGGGQYSTAPDSVARAASGLCWYHWKFGDRAAHCDRPCSWAGN